MLNVFEWVKCINWGGVSQYPNLDFRKKWERERKIKIKLLPTYTLLLFIKYLLFYKMNLLSPKSASKLKFLSRYLF